MRVSAILPALAAPLLISAADAPEDMITPDSVRAHVEFLAGDELEGRETGTRGYDVAAHYVASRFLSLGLKPAGTKAWYQPVPFAGGLVDNAASSVSIAGQSFVNRKEINLLPGRNAGLDSYDGAVVFGGYCIEDPKTGFRDLSGLKIKGKLVACLHGFPKGTPSDVGAHYSRTKSQMVQRFGGMGVVTIRTLERDRVRPWARDIDGSAHPALGWAQADGSPFTEAPNIRFSLTLHDKAAEALFQGAPVSLNALLTEADKPNMRPKGFELTQKISIRRTTTVSRVTSPNVIAMLPGSDPALANEYVLLTAHLDHNGVDESRAGDKIFNGALDNASGIASMIEAARALASSKNRPRRPILFAALTAEEKGLLGADYLARNPVVSGGRVVGVVNLDMPILLYDFQDVIAFGAEHSTLGPIVGRASAKMGVALSPDPTPSEGLFTRSDHYMFVKQGVPSVFLVTGYGGEGAKMSQDFLRNHYHRVSDDTQLPINWNAGAKFARLNYLIAAEIANADSAPRWYGDSFFGNLFAPGAPKAAREK